MFIDILHIFIIIINREKTTYKKSKIDTSESKKKYKNLENNNLTLFQKVLKLFVREKTPTR